MTRLMNILRAYRAGAVTAAGAQFEIGRLITPDNVHEIMSQLPPEFIEDMSRWDFDVEDGMAVGSNMTLERAREIEAEYKVALPALKAWFRNRAAAEKPADGTLLPARSESRR